MNASIPFRITPLRWMLEPRHAAWLVPLSAGLPQLAFPPLEWAPVAWIALVPLLMWAERGRASWGFGIGWGWGLVYNAIQFRWLPEALLEKGGLTGPTFAVLTSVTLAVAALYPAAAIGLTRWLRIRFGVPIWSSFPVLFSVQDALLGVTPLGGFPWGSLAATQTETWVAVWAVPVFGGSGLVFLLAAANSCCASVVLGGAGTARKANRGWPLSVAALLALLALCNWPSPAAETAGTGQEVWIVPGDVPVQILARSSQGEEVLRGYLAKTLPALQWAATSREPALVIWPESAVPGEVSQGRKLADLFELSSVMQVDFLFGSNTRERGRLFNSIFLVGSERFQTLRYDKRHLVPFGEYVPDMFRSWFGKKLTEGVQDYASGGGPALLDWRGTKLGLAVCFESILPGHARGAALDGAEVLIVLSNDQWLTASASRQHLRLIALRSLEIGREALAATNGGWSGHVRQGKLAAASARGGALLRVSFERASHQTPWTRWGYASLGALFVLWLAAVGTWRGLRQRW